MLVQETHLQSKIVATNETSKSHINLMHKVVHTGRNAVSG